MTIDLSLKNKELYEGCEIEEVAGRLNLITPVSKAIYIVGRNIEKLVIEDNQVILTGAMAIWAYLVVFHSVVHRVKAVYYNDGKDLNSYLVAKHG